MNRKIKQQKGNKQYYVRVSKENWIDELSWLTEHGYKNIHNLTPDTCPDFPPVIVIQNKEFFGTNVTCMACAATNGHRAIDFDTYLAEIDSTL